MKCLGEHWGLEFTPEEIAAARARNGLLSLELELSRACNLRCIYCYASSGIAQQDEMQLGEILDVVDQAVTLGARKIIVLGGGEPMLYPHLFTVIDHILSLSVAVDLFTNGMLITPAKAKALYDRSVTISVKMNSRTPAVQDYLAGHNGAYEAINLGLRNLIAAGYPDKDHILGVETIICRQNYDELPDLWRWARRLAIIPYVEMMTLQGRAKEHPDLEVPIERIQDLFERLARIDAQEFDNRWLPHPPLAASQCARHEYSCTVTATGEVNPCPGVNIAVGNIREQTLAEIIQKSSVIHDLRNIRTTIKGRCNRCDFGEYCYGCRGHAYQVTGDYLAEDPLCWLDQAR
ncbi:MAG: radical SAM/SPASM domain-containing protein [Deltaproteobacteria bacterium RIFOXYD12_FULL_50_9]|nr:MAG: radical SAM/SPASM domain-containing protein [Deltaproteobacteria bacterium RIFOXYD12_FULL_50_9]